MDVQVVVLAQGAERAMGVVDIAGDVEVAFDLHGAVVLQLEEAAGAVDEPELARWGWRWRGGGGPGRRQEEAVLGVALLWDDQHLIARRGWAEQAPAVAGPWGQYRQPPGEDIFGLQGDASGGGGRVHGGDEAETRGAAGLILRCGLRLEGVHQAVHGGYPMGVGASAGGVAALEGSEFLSSNRWVKP